MKILTHLMDTARNFTMFDYAVFKITLLSGGMLLGMYLHAWLAPHAAYLWGLFLLAYACMAYRVFRK